MRTLVLDASKNLIDGASYIEEFDTTAEEKVKLSILRDLLNLNWTIQSSNGKIEVAPPAFYDRTIIRQAMSARRNELIQKSREWIDRNTDFARQHLAFGPLAVNSSVEPVIEVCETTKQHRLFRFFRYYWSSPYSEYVGRRIKILVRDAALPNKPVIGIAALGSPIVHIPERDNYIGWSKDVRTRNLIYAMDAYTVGALPPYNFLLGGKLISYILVSNEIREIYRRKYSDRITLISGRQCEDMVCLFTTGLYGKSSQYNRIRYGGKLLYQPIGQTKGYGTLHLSEATINLMKELISVRNIQVGNRFGDGPVWKMRLIRTVGDLLGFDSDFLLQHSFARSIYFVPLVNNSLPFLNGTDRKPEYLDYPLKSLVEYWRNRWLSNRKKNPEVIRKVVNFNPDNFELT